MRVFYPEFIPGPEESAAIRRRLGSAAYLWSGVCISSTPVEDRRPWWKRWFGIDPPNLAARPLPGSDNKVGLSQSESNAMPKVTA